MCIIGPDKQSFRALNFLLFSFSSIQTCVLGAQKTCNNEMVLLSNHNIRFGREIRKIIFINTLLSEGLGISSEYALFGWKKSSGIENSVILKC